MWAETTLKHFCIVANGVSIGKTVVVPDFSGYKVSKRRNRPYFTGDIGGLLGPLRRKVRGKSVTRSPLGECNTGKRLMYSNCSTSCTRFTFGAAMHELIVKMK